MANPEKPDWSGRTVGVTGAGGFIGERMVARAANLGAEVRGLDVSEDAAARAESHGAEVRVGDTRDERDVEAFTEGCDLVVHTAAVVGEGGDREYYRSINVGGTENVAEAAAGGSVDRLVHLSSVMVYGFDYPPEVDEEGPLRGEGNPYCETKIESERAVERYHGEDLAVTVVRPGDVYGPRSQPWVVRPLELLRQRLFALPDGGSGKIDPTYVDNLVDAIVLLVDEKLDGTYNANDGETVTAREFFGYHADMLGGRWIPTAPAGVLRALFGAVGSGFRLFGREPPATPDAVDFLNRPHAYSNRRIREAGHVPEVGLDEGMRRVEEWADREGLLG